METALVILLLIIGAVAGGLIVAAWMSDRKNRAWIADGVLHFDGPLSSEEAATLRDLWNNSTAKLQPDNGS